MLWFRLLVKTNNNINYLRTTSEIELSYNLCKPNLVNMICALSNIDPKQIMVTKGWND